MVDCREDGATFSNFTEVAVKHWLWEAEVDFSGKRLVGSVTLQIAVLEDAVEKMVLDTRSLSIKQVSETSGVEEKNLLFECVGEQEEGSGFGTPLTIHLLTTQPLLSGAELKVRVDYETSPDASALQWLSPDQTVGKKQPYLFTQCEAIHARSMLPCQDTPSIKSTYTAQVSVPKELTTLMSASRLNSGCPHPTNPALRTFGFEQKVPVPSYLAALVVGDLEFRSVGPRSCVWSEKGDVEKAEYEFAETEEMLQAAERIMGPYLWGQYDLLVLPPSFPYGGMENPCLTFVTPTLLAGDRSLVNVVAHEVSHSWTGNLVTNCSWEHFWLNEGFTRYLENRIVGQLYGEKERNLHALCGWKCLEDAVNHFGSLNPLTALVPNLKGIDPDDAFSSVPYEKGLAFLLYLEGLLGGPAVFEKFLKAYVEKFKYQSICTGQWKDDLCTYFKDKEKLLEKVEWDKWFYSPGMPPQKPQYDTTLVHTCTSLADKWIESKNYAEFSPSDVAAMSSMQLQVFLDKLLTAPPLELCLLDAIDSKYQLSQRTNSEVKFRWLRLCLRAGKSSVFSAVTKFITEQGRMKFVRPLYRELFRCEGGKELAVSTFQSHRDFYHTIAATMIAKDLGLNQ